MEEFFSSLPVEGELKEVILNFIRDEEIAEIMVSNNQIWISKLNEKGETLPPELMDHLVFEKEEWQQLTTVVHSAYWKKEGEPIVEDYRFSDGRLSIICEPISINGPAITVRKVDEIRTNFMHYLQNADEDSFKQIVSQVFGMDFDSSTLQKERLIEQLVKLPHERILKLYQH